MDKPELKQLLETLRKNLHILEVREAKYSGNAPLDLLNQIEDYKTAIELVESRLHAEISAEELSKQLAPLNLSLDGGGTEIILGDKIEGAVLNLFNLPWQWIAGVLVLAGLVFAAVTYGPDFYHWYKHKASNDEILILLADFNDESENQNYDAAGSISEALQEALTQYDLPSVRLVRISQTFKRDDLEEVQDLGGRYNATIFIWGHYDDGGMFPRFMIVQEERLRGRGAEGPADYLVNLANPRDDFTFYVNRDLPSQMAYFVQFTMGQIFYFEGSYHKALDSLKGAIKSAEDTQYDEIRNNLALTYFWKGYIYQAVNKSNQLAIRDYDKAIELNPDYEEAYNNRGLAHHDSGNLEQAIRDYDEAIELNPNRAATYNNRGNALYDSGDLEQAIRDYDKAIELESAFAVAYNNRGIAYVTSGNLEQAIRDYDKAIELNPDYAEAYNNRGLAYYKSRDPEKAIRDLEQYLQLAPNASSREREAIREMIALLKRKLQP